MRDRAAPPDDWSDHALSLLFSDGAAARARAHEVLQAPASRVADQAIAHAVLALCELREGDATDGLRHRDALQALVEDSGAGTRAQDLFQQVQAQWHRREGRLDAAEGLLQPLHERVGQRPVVEAYLSAGALGIVLSMQGNDHASLDLFYQALALARQSGRDALLVNALNNLGSLQSDLHNLEDAAPLLEECLAGALRLGSRRQVIYAAGNLVQCLCLMGQAARALEVARQHLIDRIRPDDLPALQRREEIALALLDNGFVDEAEQSLSGTVHVDPLSNELVTARVWLGARIHLARGRAADALRLCLGRQELLEQQGDGGTVAVDRVNLARVAAEAAAGVGDHALAYRLLGKAFDKHEELLGRAARSRLLSLQIAHRLRGTERERDAAQTMATQLESLNATLQAQVAETQRLQRQLQAQALEDALTGLHNRRHLMQAGPALLAMQRRRNEPMAVVVVDLDLFKEVNDRHGHEAGDRVLRGFAELARAQMRAEDMVFRHGGEEFALLLAGARAPQALARMNQLLAAFRALRFASDAGGDFGCSFSAGVVESTGGDESLSELLIRADAALYEAKRAGRGRVRVQGLAGGLAP